MIKKIYDITLKDVILLDATKSANHLKSFRFIPIWFCRKQLEKLAKEIFDLIGSESEVDKLQDDFDKLISYRGLQILEALYKLVVIEMRLKAKVGSWRILAGKEYKESEQLKEILADVLKYTGIEIQQPEDLKKLNDYIEYRIDKHKEMYPKKESDEEDREPVSLSRIVYSVFNFMSESYNENMRLITFIEMKTIAEERIRKSKTNEDGQFE